MNPNFISVEGVVLPNEPLSNIQLISSVKTLKIKKIIGMFVRDKLPWKQSRNTGCSKLNLDNSFGPDTHWTAWHKSGSKSGSRGGENFYFESYGLRPPDELVHYSQRPVLCSSEQVQPNGQTFCGHLCLCVLKKLSSGCHFQEMINTALKFLPSYVKCHSIYLG